MEFIPLPKGKLLLVYEGYLYKKDRNREEKTYWKCTDDECRGRAVTTFVFGDFSLNFFLSGLFFSFYLSLFVGPYFLCQLSH